MEKQTEQVVEPLEDYQVTESESTELANLETTIERGLKTFWEVGNALLTIRDKRLYRERHSTFEAYCVERWGFTDEQARRLMRGSEVLTNLQQTPPIGGVLPNNESQVRPLTKLKDPSQQRQAWQKAVDSAANGKPTAADVTLATKEIKESTNGTRETTVSEGALADDVESTLHEVLGDEPSPVTKEQGKPFDRLASLMSSASPEHYTPKYVLDAVIDCFGEIELDPCSNNKEHPNVPAKRHFTLEDDGLSLDWKAETLFMNPPYGRAIEPWIEKLVSSHSSGNVVSAIALVPARTDTQWFKRLRDYPVCFVEGRITFVGNEDPAPFPSAFFYLGARRDKFYQAFQHLGDIWERIEPDAVRESVDELTRLRTELETAQATIAELQSKLQAAQVTIAELQSKVQGTPSQQWAEVADDTELETINTCVAATTSSATETPLAQGSSPFSEETAPASTEPPAPADVPAQTSAPAPVEVPASESPEKSRTDSPERKQLGKILGISYERVRQLEVSGELAERGWEAIPGTKHPVRYRPTQNASAIQQTWNLDYPSG
jgi:hypothetical protein